MPCSEPDNGKKRGYSTNPTEESRVSRGRAFEQRARQFYLEQGFEILEQNWQAGHKEIDLIVRKGDTVAFVEVKAGHSRTFGHPVERVDKKKISNLTEAAQTYIQKQSLTGCDFRFDVVTFFEGRLEHFPDAFRVE